MIQFYDSLTLISTIITTYLKKHSNRPKSKVIYLFIIPTKDGADFIDFTAKLRMYVLMSVRSWSFLLDGSKKARFLLKNQLYSMKLLYFVN